MMLDIISISGRELVVNEESLMRRQPFFCQESKNVVLFLL